MSVEVIAGSNNEWNFFEAEPTPSRDDTPLAEPLSPIERDTLLGEQLLCLSQTLSNDQEHEHRIQQGTDVERRTLLAERLRCLSQELSDTQDHYDQCIGRRREAMALGQPFSEIEFQTVTADLNRLIPERLACIVAIEEANDAIRNQGGIDTYGLAAHLARVAYQNPALTDQEDDSLFDSTPSLAQLLTLE